MRADHLMLCYGIGCPAKAGCARFRTLSQTEAVSVVRTGANVCERAPIKGKPLARRVELSRVHVTDCAPASTARATPKQGGAPSRRECQK